MITDMLGYCYFVYYYLKLYYVAFHCHQQVTRVTPFHNLTQFKYDWYMQYLACIPLKNFNSILIMIFIICTELKSSINTDDKECGCSRKGIDTPSTP